jgi:hypothetical protein
MTITKTCRELATAVAVPAEPVQAAESAAASATARIAYSLAISTG